MKAMKKLLALICLALALCALSAASACAEETCDHVWIFLHNNEYHWGVCALCDAEYEQEVHYVSCLSDDPEACTACGARISEGAVIESEMHFFHDDDLYYDAYTHFSVCENCGKHVNVEYHFTTCQAPDHCQVCGAETAEGAVMDTVYHEWRTEYDKTAHWDTCALCGEKTAREEHFIGCTEEDKTACTYCGAKASDGAVLDRTAHYYNGEIEWKYNQEEHWFICVRCGQEVFKAHHYALCLKPGVCAECGIPWNGEVTHINNHLDEYSPYDGDYHRFVCENCGETVLEAHLFGEDDVCDYCGYQKPSQETVPAKYALKNVHYDGQNVTGSLKQTEGNAPAKDLAVRVTFFITGNYYMATSAEVEADGSFEVEGVGPIEFITLAASGLAEGAQERTLVDTAAIVVE